MKKSLLVKLLILFSIIGIFPLTIASVYSYYKSRESILSNAYNDMTADAKDVASNINHLFNKARSDLLLLTVNPAFKRYFLEPEKKAFWLTEVHKAYLYLSSIFPDSFDEGCFILSDGKEISRVVYNKLAAPSELDTDETRNAFFAPTFAIPEGEVYQGIPYISTDTNRWVLSSSTPISLPDGRKAAIAHMELNAAYFKNIIKNILSENEEGFILDEHGNIISATWFDIGSRQPFPKASDIENSPSYRTIIERMIKRENGFERIIYKDKWHLIAFNPVHFSKYNENRWSVGVMTPEHTVYASITPLRYILLILSGSSIVIIIAVFFGAGIAKPINMLAAISGELAKGNLKKRIDIKRKDEIGQLAAMFNEMASSLEEDAKKIEKELNLSNTLLKIIGFLITKPSMDDILPRIVDAIKSLIPLDTCSIMLLDENKEYLTIRSSCGLDDKYTKGVRLKNGDGIAGWVVLYNKPLLLHGPIQDNRFKNYMEHEKDITSSICIPIETGGIPMGVVCITTKGEYRYEKDDMNSLTLIVGNLAIAIKNASLFEEIKETNIETIMALAQALETKDVYTKGHSQRMVQLTMTVAERLGLTEENKELLRYAAILHDIGKIGVPDGILNKPDKLTNEEHELIKQHSISGAEIVRQVKALQPVASIILHHHERWDGKGYPSGIKGEEIPIEARIVSVLDAFDAMTSDRPYRKALSIEMVTAELKRHSGTQFDPKVVDALIEGLESLNS